MKYRLQKRLLFVLIANVLFWVSNPLSGQGLQLKEPVRFLALGDSYTIGESVAQNERWPLQLRDSLLARSLEVEVTKVIATTGWRTDNLLDGIRGKGLADENYNLVSLLIGVNNQYQGRPISGYEPQFRQLLDSCLHYAGNDPSSVFVLSIPDYAYTPFGQNWSDPGQISRELDEYNAINKEVSREYGVTYFDITPISRRGVDNPALVAGDGLHPSGLQYTLWVNEIIAQLEKNGLTNTEEQPDLKKLTVYPVPANERVVVEGLEEIEASTIRLSDASGRLISTIKLSSIARAEIEVGQLPPGRYFLQAMEDQLVVAKGSFIVK